MVTATCAMELCESGDLGSSLVSMSRLMSSLDRWMLRILPEVITFCWLWVQWWLVLNLLVVNGMMVGAQLGGCEWNDGWCSTWWLWVEWWLVLNLVVVSGMMAGAQLSGCEWNDGWCSSWASWPGRWIAGLRVSVSVGIWKFHCHGTLSGGQGFRIVSIWSHQLLLNLLVAGGRQASHWDLQDGWSHSGSLRGSGSWGQPGGDICAHGCTTVDTRKSACFTGGQRRSKSAYFAVGQHRPKLACSTGGQCRSKSACFTGGQCRSQSQIQTH